MKKILLSVFCLLMVGQVSAQLLYKLVRCKDNYGMELNEYIYDESHTLIATFTKLTGEYECYDSLKYDDRGNIVKLSGWQLLFGRYTNVYYVDYTYDNSNRITSCSNYNIEKGNWTLGGTYTYSYDNQGRKVLTQLKMGGSIIQKVEYSYDGNLLKEEKWFSKNGLSMVESEKLCYFYNESGRLTSMRDSMDNGSGYYLFSNHVYNYDGNGNCISHIVYDDGGNITTKHLYTYSDMLQAETLMPCAPDLTRPGDTTMNTNVYTKEEYWSLDANWTLQHICDYSYEYIGINESGVDDAVIEQIEKVRKVMIEGKIYIERGNELYDMSGRRVK